MLPIFKLSKVFHLRISSTKSSIKSNTWKKKQHFVNLKCKSMRILQNTEINMMLKYGSGVQFYAEEQSLWSSFILYLIYNKIRILIQY